MDCIVGLWKFSELKASESKSRMRRVVGDLVVSITPFGALAPFGRVFLFWSTIAVGTIVDLNSNTTIGLVIASNKLRIGVSINLILSSSQDVLLFFECSLSFNIGPVKLQEFLDVLLLWWINILVQEGFIWFQINNSLLNQFWIQVSWKSHVQLFNIFLLRIDSGLILILLWHGL